MTGISSTVFSEYEYRKLVFKIDKDSVEVPCVGSFEEELEVKTVVKNCRGTVAKTRTRGTGNGTITISGHIPNELYQRLFNFLGADGGLKKGVHSYGKKSLHPEFMLTADVFDEDDNEKLKAYPRCTIQSNLSRSTENGGDEVAEIELEIAVMPDDNEQGLYEALASEVDEDVKTKWMNEFNLELVTGAE